MNYRQGFLALCLILAGWAGVAQAQEQALMDAIKANPKNVEAHYKLGAIYFNTGRYDLAAEEFKTCMNLNPSPDMKEMYESSQGVGLYKAQNFPNAVGHFQEVLKINPKNQNAGIFLADSYTQMGQFDKAEAAWKSFAAASPDDAKAQVAAENGLSKVYLHENNFEGAVSVLSKVVKANPNDVQANQNLGYAYFKLKKYDMAVQYWKNAASLVKDAQIYKFLGYSYYNVGDFANAIKNYNKSIEVESAKDPKEQNKESLGETYYNLAVAYNDNALYDEAANAFDQAFKINPQDSNAAVGKANAIDAAVNLHMEKASNFLLNNQYSHAIGEWQTVLKFQPDNKQVQDFITDAQSKVLVEVKSHLEKGNSYYKKGNTVQALNEWNIAKDMDPTNEQVLAAIKKVKVNTNARKGRVKELLSEGDELYAANDFEGARSKFEEAKALDPKSSAVKKSLSKLKKNQNSEFDQNFNAGKAFLKKGKLKDALRSLEAANRIDPNNEDVKEKLFYARKEVRNKVTSLLDSGASLFESGSKDKAKAKFQEVLALDPNNEKANDYIRKMTGEQSQQKVNAEKAKSLYYEGVNLYINGKISEAIATWQECLKQDPGNVNAQKNIDKAEVKLKAIGKLSHN